MGLLLSQGLFPKFGPFRIRQDVFLAAWQRATNTSLGVFGLSKYASLALVRACMLLETNGAPYSWTVAIFHTMVVYWVCCIGCVVPCCAIIYGDIPFGSSGNLTKAGDPHESSATWTGDSVMGRVTLGTGPPDFFEPQNSCELGMFIPRNIV